jgi:hypothetical protein
MFHRTTRDYEKSVGRASVPAAGISRVGCALRTFIMHRRDACATKFS